MNDLMRTEFLALMSKGSQVTNEETQSAYEDFTAQVVTPDSSETDYSAAFRRLNYVRIEMESFSSSFLYGVEKKCAEKSIPS